MMRFLVFISYFRRSSTKIKLSYSNIIYSATTANEHLALLRTTTASSSSPSGSVGLTPFFFPTSSECDRLCRGLCGKQLLPPPFASLFDVDFRKY
ncbi:hypothetical protein HPP92_001105 [Vanilla planifolia]|uniref:Uncharacterized protein n=1 Tax=Vanilla planifolia TaxID=51239 RepID=A0A835SC15_VANPL|nr:hypothetical protein HPP92_001105 [Vanilla planifolia]